MAKGNPLAGRAARIRAVLLKALTPEDAKEIAAVLIALAKGGDLAAIRELLDRTAGKPTIPVEVTGAEGGPIQVEQRITDLSACLRAFEQFNGGESDTPNNGT
jgi:hypothetical protein